MLMAARSGALALVAVLAAAGCAAENASARRRPSLMDGEPYRGSYTTPGRWYFHPQRTAKLEAELRVDDSSTLFLGAGGERYLERRSDDWVGAALERVPQPLTAAIGWRSGRWVLVGAAGGTFEAEEPLGPIVASSAPPEPMVSVAVAGQVLVGVSAAGALWRSADAGLIWEQVGPDGGGFVDLGVRPDAPMVAVRVPEQLWQSRDEGQTWARVEQAPQGISAVARDLEAGSCLRGVLGDYTWSGQ